MYVDGANLKKINLKALKKKFIPYHQKMHTSINWIG